MADLKKAKSTIEQAWSLALDYLDDPIYIVDLEDRLLLDIRDFYKKIKSNPDIAVGRPVTEFTHPEGEAHPCRVCQARRSLQDAALTLEPDDPVNKIGVPLEISIKVVRDEQNQAVSIIQKMTDLTSIRKTAQLIKENEALLRALLMATPDPLVVSDNKGIIQLVNDVFIQQFGYQRDEIIGTSIEGLVPREKRRGHIKLRGEYMGESMSKSLNQVREIEGLHKDGRRIPLEINLSPLKLGEETLIISTLHDLSERKAHERELRRLASFSSESPIPILEFNRQGEITYSNPLALEIWPDIKQRSFKHPILYNIPTMLKQVERQDILRDIEVGGVIYEQKISFFKELDRFRVYAWDITKIRKMSRKMAYLASHDNLTGLINRREFENQLEAAIQSAVYKTHVLCLMDLDKFKSVNDTAGHLAGDELLKKVSALFETHVREGDSLARLGGDEFGLLLLGCPLEKAVEIAENLRTSIHHFRFEWEEHHFQIGVSIGLSIINEDTATLSNALKFADNACYQAKARGRNSVVVYGVGS